jgi:hypothetical protein
VDRECAAKACGRDGGDDLRGFPVSESKTQELLVGHQGAGDVLLRIKEFSAEIGAEMTAEIMKRAIYKRGLEIGKPFRKFAPATWLG